LLSSTICRRGDQSIGSSVEHQPLQGERHSGGNFIKFGVNNKARRWMNESGIPASPAAPAIRRGSSLLDLGVNQ
jgi:hypothetical protein